MPQPWGALMRSFQCASIMSVEQPWGVSAPRNTPAEIVDTLNIEINAGLANPELKARFSELGATVFGGSPADFGVFIAQETEKWGKVIPAARIKAE